MLPRGAIMARVAVLCFVAFFVAPTPAAETKDTPAAAHTRTKKLKAKVTVDWKGISIKEAMKDISNQLEDLKLGTISLAVANGASLDTKITFSATGKPVDEVLDGALATIEYGYVVVAKEKDRYDGWLKFTKGKERGYEVGTEPGKTVMAVPPTTPTPSVTPMPVKPAETLKPAENDEDEKQARLKMDQAKKFVDDGKKDQAKVLIAYVLKKFPNTKAAAEAKELQGKLDK